MILNPENILTVEECATLLKVAPKSVYRLIKEKKIKAIKILSMWRILKEDLENFLSR